MAATGLRLDHFYAAHPSCSPTRGSVLTGRHPRPEDLAATIYHLLGIPKEMLIIDQVGRSVPISPGRPIAGIL